MVATELKSMLRTAAEKINQLVTNAAEMKVETRTIAAGASAESVLAARTTLSLDGDNLSEIPAIRSAEGEWKIDAVLHDLHIRNVQTAIEYRTRMLSSMLSLLGSLRGEP